MQIEKIRVEKYSLARLAQEIEQGKLRIPRFQREYIWDRPRVRKLFDSMVKEYPIGTLFIWDAPAKYNHFLRNVEDLKLPPINLQQNYMMIIDGQQRLTSLYAVIKGLAVDDEDFGRLVIDLSVEDAHEQELFSFRSPDNKRWVSVKDLLGPNPFSIYESLSHQNFKPRFERYRSLLTNYPFSVVEVSNMKIGETIEIFERINQQGKRLSRYDLIAASVMTEEFDLREKTEVDLIEELPAGFRELNETSIPQALALNTRNNTEFQTQMNLKSEDIQAAWNRTIESLLQSVEFVRSRYQVVRLEFLPYESMLPVLQHYFYVSKSVSSNSRIHLEQIDSWFWQAAFSNRYSSASQTAMTNDATDFRELVNSQKEFSLTLTTTAESLTQGFMSATTSAVRNGILCLLNLQQPRRFDTGEEFQVVGPDFERFTRAENHHIFPSGFLKMQGFMTKDVHRIPNFCFIPANLNRKIGDSPPSQYMDDFRQKLGEHRFREVMRSHIIPVGKDSGIWRDDYQLFLKQRSTLLLEEIQYLSGARVRLGEEQRNPAIDIVETALRDIIHNSLFAAEGAGYWKENVESVGGGTIHRNIQKRIDDHILKNPGYSLEDYKRDLRARWDFADVSDYLGIIENKKNWNHFAKIFPSKGVAQRNLTDFHEFRNLVKHNREVDDINEHRGKAAILWLSDLLDIDLSELSNF